MRAILRKKVTMRVIRVGFEYARIICKLFSEEVPSGYREESTGSN